MQENCEKCGDVKMKCKDCGKVFCAHCDNNSNATCPECHGANTTRTDLE